MALRICYTGSKTSLEYTCKEDKNVRHSRVGSRNHFVYSQINQYKERNLSPDRNGQSRQLIQGSMKSKFWKKFYNEPGCFVGGEPTSKETILDYETQTVTIMTKRR